MKKLLALFLTLAMCLCSVSALALTQQDYDTLIIDGLVFSLPGLTVQDLVDRGFTCEFWGESTVMTAPSCGEQFEVFTTVPLSMTAPVTGFIFESMTSCMPYAWCGISIGAAGDPWGELIRIFGNAVYESGEDEDLTFLQVDVPLSDGRTLTVYTRGAGLSFMME